MTIHHRQSGFSMIELMISVAMGLFMVAAILVAYVSAAQNFRVQEAMSEVQEDGRYASIQLLHDIRQSGFGRDQGEPKVLGYNRVRADINNLHQFAKQVSGDAAFRPTLAFNRLRSPVVYMPVEGERGAAYYLATGANGRLSLYRNGDGNGSSELIEGVEGLVFEFGLDSDSDNIVDVYKFQAQMNGVDWRRAQSIRFYLLLSSSSTNVVDMPQVLAAPFNGVNTADRRLYRVFVGTAGIRNATAML
ncbi:MAG: PilW family protein [Amphritea sp.]|nr:PilW family protein [Amphritea sp.]